MIIMANQDPKRNHQILYFINIYYLQTYHLVYIILMIRKSSAQIRDILS